MTDIATRLRLAREAAGFTTAAEAAERFGWNYPTYAGHENGSRGIRTDVVRRYALAFRVSPLWLIDGSQGENGRARLSSKPPGQLDSSRGFSDSDLAPYIPASATQKHAISAAIASLTPGWRHIETWISGRNWHAYAIVKDDIVVIGSPPSPAPGDIVVASWADPDSITTLGQRSADTVILPPGEPHPIGNPAILGTVAMVIRPPRSAD